MANQLQSELIRQARGMRQSQKSAGSLAADSVNIISALEKLSQGLESPVQKFADSTVSRQLTANIYDRNLKKRTKESNIRKAKGGAIAAIGERLDSPDIDLEGIEKLRKDLEDYDTKGPDHEVLEALKVVVGEDANNKEAWLNRKNAMMFGTEDSPGIYRSLSELEKLREGEFESGQYVFSVADNKELENALEDISLRAIKATENKYTSQNDFIKNRVEDLKNYLYLRENFQQLDAIVDTDPATKEKLYGKFDMPTEIINLSPGDIAKLKSEEGLTVGTVSDLMNETMRQMQSGDIDKARKYYDMAASARNKQIETKIYRDRQDASNAMNNFGEGMKGSIKNYAGQVDDSAKQVNNIIQTMKDNDNLQYGMIKMPSVLQGATNFDGLRESVAKGILNAIMESGGSAAAERWNKLGASGTNAVIAVRGMMSGADFTFQGDAFPYKEANLWDREKFGDNINWSGWGDDERLGDTYYGSLLDLWDKLENQSSILDALNKAVLTPGEEISKDSINLPQSVQNINQ